MPTYTFYNKETNEEWTELMSMSEREKFLEDNPHVEQKITSFHIADPWSSLGAAKPPSDFSKYVLGKVRDKMPGAEKSVFERRWSIPKEI